MPEVIWFHYIIIVSYEEDHQVLGFINPVVDSVDKDKNIYGPERRFSVF